MPQQGHTLGNLPFQLAFCLDLTGDAANHLKQFFVVDGLQEILFYLQIDRTLGISKLLIAGHEYKAAWKVQPPGLADHFQSVQHRHSDVADDDVRLFLLHQSKSFFTVGCGAHHLIAQVIPVNALCQPPADNAFVVYDCDCIHIAFPSTPFTRGVIYLRVIISRLTMEGKRENLLKGFKESKYKSGITKNFGEWPRLQNLFHFRLNIFFTAVKGAAV